MNQNFRDIIPEIIDNGYSRIPVYKDNIDTIIGVLYVKDLLPHLIRKHLIGLPYYESLFCARK